MRQTLLEHFLNEIQILVSGYYIRKTCIKHNSIEQARLNRKSTTEEDEKEINYSILTLLGPPGAHQ